MTIDQKKNLLRALRFWAGSFILVAGFLYYHSPAPLGPILLAGLFTLTWTAIRYLRH